MNVLPRAPVKSFGKFFMEAANDRTLILLSIAAILSLGVHHAGNGWIEGVAILVAVLIVALVNSTNDWQKERLFRALSQKNQQELKATVLRDGKKEMIAADRLTVGDIIYIEPGEVLPVDAVLLSASHNLLADESSATGESKNLRKTVEEDPFLLSGTKILDGVGEAVVVAVGAASFHGRMIMAMRGDVGQTPLQQKLDKLANSIAKVGLSLAVALLLSLSLKELIQSDFKWKPVLSELPSFLVQSITIIVVAVPEGLPMAVTLALAFATTRMLQDNNLVRVLASCETMGRATTICSDKTGTLTENRMTVVKGLVAGVIFDRIKKGDNEEKDNSAQPQTKKDALVKLKYSVISEKLSQLIAVNSTAFENFESESGQVEFVGSNTEIALLRFLRDEFEIAYGPARQQVDIVNVVPFASERKMMTTRIKIEDGKDRVLIKGAAEIILAKCGFVEKFAEGKDSIVKIDDKEERDLRRFLNEMSADALRNIALAYKDVDVDVDDEQVGEDDFVLVALVGIEDVLRSGVPEAVAACQKAGIFVRMVTGDNRATAESIAKRCGILMRGGLVMDGPEFRALEDSSLLPLLPRLQVLARSSPLDKQRLVRLLRNDLNEIVAVTGDGTNDGPALKAAHVGFSMGITGTQVAQEASAIVLLDDNFTSIVKAVSWGRCITDSVRKFLQFQLTVNVAAVLTAFITALLTEHGKSVLTAVQLLWVNLIMDSFGALALATDRPTAELLERQPENPKGALITSPMRWHIASQAILQLFISLGTLYFWTDVIKLLGLEPNATDALLRTFVFNTFVMLQLANELNCRHLDFGEEKEFSLFAALFASFRNPNWIFWTIWLGTLIVQIGIVQFGGSVFATVPIASIKLWIISVMVAFFTSIPLCVTLRLMRPWRFRRSAHSTDNLQSPRLLGSTTGAPHHPSRQQLQWHSAVQQVTRSRNFFEAIRRKIDANNGNGNGSVTSPASEHELLLTNANVGVDADAEENVDGQGSH